MKDSTILIIAIMLVAVMVAPSLFNLASSLIDSMLDFVKYGFDFENGAGGEPSQAGVNLKVYSTDGSMTELSVAPSHFLPLMIPIQGDMGGEPVYLDRVEADITVTLQYEGSMTGYDSTWSWDVYLTNGFQRVADLSTETRKVTGNDPSGSPFQWIITAQNNPLFQKHTVKASELESKLYQSTTGTYTLCFDLKIDMTVTFATGESDSITANTQAIYSFDWTKDTERISSLTITVDASPLT